METIELFKAFKIEKNTELEFGDEFGPSNRDRDEIGIWIGFPRDKVRSRWKLQTGPEKYLLIFVSFFFWNFLFYLFF